MENQKKENQKQPINYWLVNFTLTSGEVFEFYVKAISQFYANEKAYEYEFWLENETLRNKLKKFRLMP